MRIRVGSIPSILFFSLTTVLLLSFGLAEDAYARAGSEISNPTQTNAYASYNTDTNQVQVSWNFNTLPTDTTCLLKGDFVWYADLNAKHTSGVSGVDYDKTTGFIPIYYSVVSSSPTIVETLSEVVACENGSIRIDIDTIMSHSENINNYEDLEIFLSFYVANADGSLNLADASRIDEVFILYTPVNIWDTAAQTYGCGGQIGSTLYIDQSAERIHGNNGDNCDGAEFEYVALNSNQWIDIGMDDSPGLALGVELKGDHVAQSYPSLYFVVSYTSTSDSGGCNDCIDPTFYYSQNRIIVQDGFRYNGFSTDLNATHTDMPELITNTTRTNFITLKVFDNSGTDGIEWIEVAFGSPGENISFDQSEVRIETQFSDNSVVESFVYPEGQTLISFGNVTVSVVSCGYESDKCLQMTIPHTFNDELVYKAIMIRAIDESRNDKYHYLNEGIKILGEPLYEPPTDKIFIQKYLGSPSSEWVDIVRIDRVDNIWSSEDGIEFKQNGGGFQRITTLGFDDTLID